MNIAVAQSGGPTCAINASLVGVFRESLKEPAIDAIFGSVNGVEGIIQDHLIDLKTMIRTNEDMELLRQTPSTVLGSCRYKLPDYHEDSSVYEKIAAVLKRRKIGAFFYIGGNDSMDTVQKLSAYFKEISLDVKVIGIPKTIDNDLCITDHTPGFGSAAKYVATTMQEIVRDSSVYSMPSITIVEIMGRNAGWLTAASALARNEYSTAPHLIYLPEVDFDMEQFLADVHRIYQEKNNVLIAVSEGIHYADGSFVSEAKASATDGFGHAQLGGLAARLAQVIKEHEHAKVRGIELSLLQRAGAHLASQTDIDEAFAAGKMAVEAALSGETGKMVAFERVMADGQYTCRMKLIPLSDVANYEKKVPVEWIVPEGNNVTQDFIDYALPLIQGVPEIPLENGLPRYARLKKVLAE
mgnify:CR=1 FL=1